MISTLKKTNQPERYSITKWICTLKTKVIVIKLGLQDTPGKHDLAEAIKALQPFWHLFILSDFKLFNKFCLLFCFVSSASLLFALMVQMNLRLPVLRSAHCAAGQKHPSVS